jgi:4'-phosphopantetheinyl transferase
VWAALLNGEPARFANFLSPAERERAACFHFECHRRRFIVGRGLLRLLLARYLRADACGLEFSYGVNGKPELAGPFADSGIRFNLAHSEDLAILAVSRLASVGVDLERIIPLEDASELVARFFSAHENAAFQKLAENQRPAAFFNLWTRKEAWLKATGEGIAHSLNLVEVSFLPGEPARLVSLPKHLSQSSSWSLYNLAPAENFAAALAIAREGIKLRCWRWEPQPTGSTFETQPC